MGSKYFHEDCIKVLPLSTKMGLRRLEHNFLVTKPYSNPQFMKEIEETLEVFSSILNEANSLLLDQLISIEDGIEFISNAIESRLQSSRYLYEAKLFDQLNIAPFSKLHLLYESFVNVFERLIKNFNKKIEDGGPTPQFKFLVNIAIHSSVNAKLFIPNTGTSRSLKKLVGITINEYSFFQIRNTIILLLHEIGHYVRPYDRKKRNELFLNLLNDWLTNLVFNELKMSLDLKPLSDGKSNGGKDEDAVRLVRLHFEKEVFPIILPAIDLTLKEYFAELLKLKIFSARFGDCDPYLVNLNDFNFVLETYIDDLSADLNDVLFSTNGKTNESRLKQIMKGYLNKVIEPTLKDGTESATKQNKIKEEYFNLLCSKATTLFEADQAFGYKKGKNNSESGVAIDIYLQWLSVLGLNEPSEENLELFINKLFQMIKMALDKTENLSILEMLRVNLNEALADMFFIRTLDIQDFESFEQIVKPIIDRESYGNLGRVKFFGPRFFIVSEYFDLANSEKSTDYQKRYIPTTDFGLLYPESVNKLSPEEEKGLKDDLRAILFKPIALYLFEKDSVFPEATFYNIKNKENLSPEGKQIMFLREHAKGFWMTSSPNNDFASEIQLINCFSTEQDYRA